MYKIKLQQFEGPFELLVELIEKKELSINQISLAEIADQYLSHLKEISSFPTAEVASFIVIASTLMLVKSRSLMPSLKLSDEEEEEIYNLEEQLKLYQLYRNLSKQLEHIFGKKIIFGREPFARVQEIFIEPKGVTMAKLSSILESIIKNFPKKEILVETLVKKAVTLEQKIEEMMKRFTEKINFCFSDVKQSGCEKMEIIVSFLAMLELIKRGLIIAKQGKNFDEIYLEKYEIK